MADENKVQTYVWPVELRENKITERTDDYTASVKTFSDTKSLEYIAKEIVAGGREDPPHPLFRLSGHDRERALLAHHHRLVRLARRGAGRQKHEVRGECDRQPDCERWIGWREALY